MKLLIKNGTVVRAGGTSHEDIYIEEGFIAGTGRNISPAHADRVIDATGKYIFPGGVDPHVHMHLPSGSGYSSDDFVTGSRAALYGGTTTIIDFVTPARGESLITALEKRKEEAQGVFTDYSFHVSPVEWRDTTAAEISSCISDGISSFKIYMAYKSTIGLDDSDIRRVLETVGKAGGVVTVHCEEGDVIEALRDRFFREGCITPACHPQTRPAATEADAVARIIDMAHEESCPLYLVHISAEASLRHIRAAQARGQAVTAETCPQYLILDDTCYSGDFDTAAPYVISPPLRTRSDNDALWEALADCTLSTVGTDHCPFTRAQKRTGAGDFRKIPNGAGGVEHRLALLFTYGVMEDKISLSMLARLFSSEPARAFGLYPRKGEIAKGSDADLVIWDPEPESTISVESHHQNCDTNIYEGIAVKGAAEYVIANGLVVVEKDRLIPSHGNGRLLRRQPD